MTIDLTMLAWCAALCLALMLPGAQTLALAPSAGGRAGSPQAGGWIGRAERAHGEMLETLIPFAALVLAVAVTGKANLMSGLGAQVFFWGCAAQAALHLAGITWARSLAWAASVAGMGLVAAALFQG